MFIKFPCLLLLPISVFPNLCLSLVTNSIVNDTSACSAICHMSVCYGKFGLQATMICSLTPCSSGEEVVSCSCLWLDMDVHIQLLGDAAACQDGHTCMAVCEHVAVQM